MTGSRSDGGFMMRGVGSALLAVMLVVAVAPSGGAPPKPLELAKVGFKLETPVAGDWGGAAIAVGDFDGDGVVDLAVGAACNGTAAPGAGATYVLYGSIIPDRSLADADAVLLGTTGDFAGEFLTTLDVDGDGANELVVGAPGPVVGTGRLVQECFEAFVLHPGIGGVLDAAEFADAIITGHATADFAGWDVGGGDLDGYRLDTPVGFVDVRAPGPPRAVTGKVIGWALRRVWLVGPEHPGD